MLDVFGSATAANGRMWSLVRAVFGRSRVALMVNVIPITLTGENSTNTSKLGLPVASSMLGLLLDIARGVGSRPDWSFPVILRALYPALWWPWFLDTSASLATTLMLNGWPCNWNRSLPLFGLPNVPEAV